MKHLIVVLLSAGCAFTSFGQTNSEKQPTLKKQGVVDMSDAADIAPTHKGVRQMPPQGLGHDIPQRTSFVFKKQAEVDMQNTGPDFASTVMVREKPAQAPKKLEYYNYPPYALKTSKKSSAVLPDLYLKQHFFGNDFSLSTPCDNDMAISDSGFIVSVTNTNIYYKNLKGGPFLYSKQLGSFTAPVNNLHQEFDPKVIYDPVRDRFVIVCLVGNVDSTSKIIVGFSKTNQGNGQYNLYVFPGDALNNGLWSDYPMIAMTENELFLSVNLLYNDSSWQAGFVETVVWQIKKDSGYAGANLPNVLHSNIKYNGKALRNLCPVKGGSKFYKPNMYFLSNRNFASQNDSVFLVNITDTIGAPAGTLTVKALKSNQPYAFPSNARQTVSTQSLATNDSRNLGAYYENNKIHYVHNTNHPVNNRPTVYYGVIDDPSSSAPTVQGYIIDNDTMDFGYPNISYAGDTATDHTSIITFDHVSDVVNPGVSAIKADGNGNFSKILRIKNGAAHVNVLTSGLERWGDYSGSQRRYNNPGEVWMSGYYGYNSQYPNTHGAWIAQLGADSMVFYVDSSALYVEVKEEHNKVVSSNVFPNPTRDVFTVEFSLKEPEYLVFELYDIQGKLVQILLRDWIKGKENVFSFKTLDLEKGVYFLRVRGNKNTRLEEKIIIE